MHPGYGFLAENAAFARACAATGLIFVGPSPDSLDLFGDKAAARAFAERCGVPLVPGSTGATDLAAAQAFMAGLGEGAAVMVKAIAGGGGRGMRPVQTLADLPAAFERCRAEALAAFGNGDLYVERLFPQARHIEVQVLGDGTGAVTHLWERECSVQRQRQKLIEIAPAPGLAADLRDRLLAAAASFACTIGCNCSAQAVLERGGGAVEAVPSPASLEAPPSSTSTGRRSGPSSAPATVVADVVITLEVLLQVGHSMPSTSLINVTLHGLHTACKHVPLR